MALEKLHLSLVFLRGAAAGERTEVPPMAVLVDTDASEVVAGAQAVLALEGQLPNQATRV